MKRLCFLGLAMSIFCLHGIGLNADANGQDSVTQEKPRTANPAIESNQPVQAETTKQQGEVPGIAIGETLPKITLKKQDGTDVSIQELLKKGPVALVFYRSAVW